MTLLSSKYMGEYFEQFGWWLKDRRGFVFAATHIMKYIDYFFQIDSLCENLGRIPNYQEVVQSFSVAISRKNLLVTTFLNEIGLLIIDKVCQEEQANKDMIDRYLKKFKQGLWESKILKAYYEHLQSKTQHKGSIRSIRLALGSAAKLLEYKGYFDSEYLTNNILDGYLWKYPGQNNSLMGFLTFLKQRGTILETSDKKQLKFHIKSTLMLKQELIIYLIYPSQELKFFQKAIRVTVGYLHNIDIPSNVIILKKDLKGDLRGMYLAVAKKKFYLPKEVELLCSIK